MITNLINQKKYIGKHKSKSFDDNYFGSGVLIQKAIKRYGLENFEKTILATANSSDELDALEEYYIQLHNAVVDENFYNLSIGGKGGWDYINSHRNELGVGMTGKHHSEETRQRISQAKFGNTHHTEETKQKLREISSAYRHTEETKKKIGDAHRGIKLSDEAKQHISDSLTGRKLSNEHRKRISEGGKGKKHKSMSEEGRKHISEARKAYFAKLKNGSITDNQ